MHRWRDLIVSAFITLVLLEAVLQVYYRVTVGSLLFDRMVIPIFVADPVRCYAVKPNLDYVHRTGEYAVRYQTDEQGFRVAADSLAITADEVGDKMRVLYLGPSYAFGWGNELADSYADLISQLLSGAGHGVEALNLGTPGQPIANQLCWVAQEAKSFRPDLVIQTVFGRPGKVVKECNTNWCPEVKHGYLSNSDVSLNKRMSEVAKTSAIVFYGWYMTKRYMVAKHWESTDPEMSDRSAAASVVNDDLFGSYAGYLAYVRASLGYDVPVVFVFIPYSYTVRPADSGRWGIADPRHAADIRVRTSAQIARLAEQGIWIVDPTDALVAADRNERMFYFVDTHLTPAGNRIVAQEVARYVKRRIQR